MTENVGLEFQQHVRNIVVGSLPDSMQRLEVTFLAPYNFIEFSNRTNIYQFCTVLLFNHFYKKSGLYSRIKSSQ